MGHAGGPACGRPFLRRDAGHAHAFALRQLLGAVSGHAHRGKQGVAQRLRNTLLAAMGMSGYGTKKLPEGEGMGVACVSSQERATASWTACVAHVAVSPSGEVKVKKLTVATDVGTQVHPDNIRAQVEGAALWGLSLAMYEKATLKDGGIEQTNFDSYTPLRMSQLPEVAVNVIANGEKATMKA